MTDIYTYYIFELYIKYYIKINNRYYYMYIINQSLHHLLVSQNSPPPNSLISYGNIFARDMLIADIRGHSLLTFHWEIIYTEFGVDEIYYHQPQGTEVYSLA